MKRQVVASVIVCLLGPIAITLVLTFAGLRIGSVELSILYCLCIAGVIVWNIFQRMRRKSAALAHTPGPSALD